MILIKSSFHAQDVFCVCFSFGLVVSEVICHETPSDDDVAASLLAKNTVVRKQLKANGFQQDLHLVKLLEKLIENCVSRKCASRPTMVDGKHWSAVINKKHVKILL